MAFKLREWAEDKYGKQKMLTKLHEIIELTKPNNAKMLELQTAQNITLERLRQLIIGGWYIEYMNTGSGLVEYAIKRIIQSHELVINSSLIFADFDTPLKVSPVIEGSQQTLGFLIKELERFCQNAKLFDNLGKFNKKRVLATHKAYEENQDISKINEQLKDYVQTHPVLEIITQLRDAHALLVNDMVKKLAEFGFVPEEKAKELIKEK